MKLNKTNSLVVPESAYGTCLWEIDGKYLSDGDGYLSLEGVVGDKRVEEKMRVAAHYWIGEAIGKPKWVRGVRKCSDMEWEDQQERFRDGKIPDPAEELRLALERGRL